MRVAPLLLGLLVLLAAGVRARADEEPPEAHAFVEIQAERERVFVGEPFTLTLRIGIDRAFFTEHAVELFRRRMDLPVQVEAPWLATLPGAQRLDEASPRGDVRFALDGREALGVGRDGVTRSGRTFEVVELTRRYLPEAAGSHALEATLLFAHATRFEEDFLGGRIAVDRRDVVVRTPPFEIEFVPLPAGGRPEAFDGAVGRYAVSASASPSESETSDGLALTLVIEGEGNLAFVDPPPPHRLEGFHVYGLIDDHGASRRTVVYEIAPLEGTTAVPAVPFAFFDPGPPAGYRVVRTEPIPLARPVPVPEIVDEVAPPRGVPWAWVFGLLGLALTGLALGRLRRTRPARGRGEATAATWSSRLDAPDADAAGIFADALAEHLGVPPAAVIGPDLEERLVRAGADTDLAARTARTMEALVAARFGGEAPDAEARAAAADLLESLVRCQAPCEE